MWYNASTENRGGFAMEENKNTVPVKEPKKCVANSDRKGFLPPNEEFLFLHRKTKLKPVTISKIALVPAYTDALRRYEGD